MARAAIAFMVAGTIPADDRDRCPRPGTGGPQSPVGSCDAVVDGHVVVRAPCCPPTPMSHSLSHDPLAAARLLIAGGVVAFPTETVYGLGAHAERLDAVRRVFAIKRRPTDHPLIVHGADAGVLDRYAHTVNR